MRFFNLLHVRVNSLNMHAQMAGNAYLMRLKFGLSLHTFPYFVCASAEGSGKTLQMHMLS